MDNEKEMLLKLLVEKYNQDDDCVGSCDEENSNTGYYGLGGSEYRVAEPEVWGEPTVYTHYTYKGRSFIPTRTSGSVAYALLSTVGKCVRVSVSESNKHRVTYEVGGGCPYDIAQTLWDTKCAGTELVGEMTIQVEDYNKVKRNVSFNYVYA